MEILLMSGVTLTVSHNGIISGDRKKGIKYKMYTIILGMIFSTIQYFEYKNGRFTISDSVYGTESYTITGLHGIHVLIGNSLLIKGLSKLIKYELDSKSIYNEMSILY
jgi:heme/copper-type cytochrome/quinol oxidase subunit 3